MARLARAVAVGIPHHVTQRGNARQDVFFTDRDREVYLNAFFDTPSATACKCGVTA